MNMEGVFRRRIQAILFFSTLIALGFAIFYGAYHGPWDPRFRRRMEATRRIYDKKPPPPPPIVNDKATLTRGQPLKIGKNKLLYHGIENEKLHIAVYILELDPEVAYHHRIPIKEAKKGIRLGGQAFNLISYGQSSLQLGLRNTSPGR